MLATSLGVTLTGVILLSNGDLTLDLIGLVAVGCGGLGVFSCRSK